MKPIVQALLLADHVYQDKGSSKFIIAGVFNRIWVKTTAHEPADHPVHGKVVRLTGPVETMGTPYAYVNLIEVRGPLPLALRYINLGNSTMAFQVDFEISCPDPLQTVEFVVPVPQLPKQLGTYALELLTNDEPLGAVRVVVEERRERTEE